MNRHKYLFRALLAGILISGLSQYLVSAGWGLSYQTSASMARGWYLLTPPRRIEKGDTVAFRLKDAVGRTPGFESVHGSPVMLIKTAAALGGDLVCTRAGMLSINGRPAAAAVDGAVAAARICRQLLSHEILVLGNRHARSFDSRYFGPVPAGLIQHKAIKL